jgi:hypothetical protein
MRAPLDELQRLSRAAIEARLGVAAANEQRSRLDALAVLGENVDALVAAIGRVQPLPPDLAAREGWDAMAGLFDRSGTCDLRELIAESIARETTAVQRERILASVWGHSEDPLTNVVDVYIRRLRSKVDEGHAVALIHTVRGLGYRLEGPAA